MASRIRVFDHFCKPLTEFTGIPTTPRSWILNKYGRCEFSIGFDANLKQSVQKCQERYLQYGNLILVEHLPKRDWDLSMKGKLPDWIGIILPPRDWDLGVVHVTAYGIESLLAFRAMPYRSLTGTPWTVTKKILDFAHDRAKNIVIQPGVMDDLSTTFSDDLRTNAYDHIQKLINDSGMDWNITGNINNKGNLELFANLYNRKGINTNLILNSTNTELSSPLLTEQGTPSNQVFGYSHAQTDESRVGPIEAIDQSSYDDYGPLQLNQVYIGKHDNNSVTNSTKTRAVNRARPSKLFRRVALDKAKTFNYLDVGNTTMIRETRVGFNPNGSYGFESQVRIIGMEYNDLSNKAPLNIEVI